MSPQHFLIGDQVRHVSGGVAMTVTGIDGDWVTVAWMDHRRHRSAVFKAAMLKPAEVAA